MTDNFKSMLDGFRRTIVDDDKLSQSKVFVFVAPNQIYYDLAVESWGDCPDVKVILQQPIPIEQ